MQFKNQVALVTGASTGIGRQIALALAREGADVAALARSADKLQSLRREIEVIGRRCLDFSCDVRERRRVFACAEQTEKELGPIEILVNNAGMGVGGAVYQVSLEDIQYQMDVNFYGVIHTTHAVLPKMLERRRGLIINISSILGKAPAPYTGYYCATKFALTAMSDAWRLELRPFNIHVLNVCPGSTSGTAFSHNMRGVDRKLPTGHERGRTMPAAEVARRTIAAAAARKREIVLTTEGRLFIAANRFAPGLTFLLMSKVIPYLRKRGERAPHS
ncbi:MAG: SDR family NAD(P)-dependent oxidoreductase [Acidobacteria bacterium]|nr:SDR family NAD(P)-dependent oxidoreductase [Acidobacteriota bacterium]